MTDFGFGPLAREALSAVERRATLCVMGDSLRRRPIAVLWALGRFVIAAAAPVAAVVAASWAVAAVYQRTAEWPFFLAMVVIGLAATLVLGTVLGLAAIRESVPRSVMAAGVAAVVLAAPAYASLTLGWTDRQVMHERGVAVTGTVEARWREGNDGGGIDPGPRLYLTARTPDGALWTLEADQDEDRPEVGRPVVFTYDPRGEVRTALGPVPGTPPWIARTIALYILCAGSLIAALACALPDSRRPEQRSEHT
ncbi:hypothetical protein ACIQBJ_31885 [Kitasatospora sp. NPDC088391]|uniref:hypothetical protein n=1 Tax=Kitasatospora sp. NPDC088391 TaxID=3364074 RepID=UPI0037F7C2F7